MYSTSLETILVDRIATAVISVCIKKIKIGENFCTAILMLKMEENTQHFQCIKFCYFKKGNNTIEMQKIYVQCMEKVL